eukprot:TRINITY_DN2548_c0_g1_i2.p1 TRINITY_DN2548_c0_g1~~TRINITY_DN2548_c0_g1_i2.p1  ORF type:complete len:920 (-),score=162.36 TRINITY_DN2548_c0_g1_i2:51-2810(-)
MPRYWKSILILLTSLCNAEHPEENKPAVGDAPSPKPSMKAERLAFLQTTTKLNRSAVTVTFKVNMSGVDVAATGVHVAGSFQDWDPSSTELFDEDNDGVYETTLQLIPEKYEFKFINGNTWEAAESVPTACGEGESGHYNRFISVASDSIEAEVSVCYGKCLACGEVPACKLYNCPGGFALREAMLNVNGDSQDACCEASDGDKVGVVVRSAAFSDGNIAQFWADGQLLLSTSSRGLTVVELSSALAVKYVKTFDTYSDSTALVTYVDNVTEGTTLLFGAADEASEALSQAAKDALRSCGGQLQDGLQYRSSYALIGVKGGEALAEAILPEGSGIAVAAAQVMRTEPQPLPASPELPWCEGRSAVPPVSGTLLPSGNLQLDADCQYKLRDFSAASAGLSGSWIVVTGSSNALLMFNTLLMMLAPSEADEQRTGRFGGAHLIDAVVENGHIIHYQTVRSSLPECIQGNLADSEMNEDSCKQAYANALALAPSYDKNKIRVTMFLSFFWRRTHIAADLVEADQAWAAADVAFVAQVCAWYLVCNAMKFGGCPRTELMEVSEDAAFSLFTSEMNMVLARLETLCAPGQRAGVHGCVVATNSWSAAGGSLGAAFDRFNAQITQSMLPFRTSTFRYMDVFALGAAMPDQTLNGHGSQILHLWTWQIMLDGMLKVGTATGWQASFEGNLCWSQAASLDKCPKYERTVLWQCMNSVLCDLQTSGQVPTTSTTTTEGQVPTTSTTTTTTTTEGARVVSFSQVDGAEAEQACRGKDASDNNPTHYTIPPGIVSVESCKEQCASRPGCVGIEYSRNRCEVWTRADGIQATIQLEGFSCLQHSKQSQVSIFWPFASGANQACRGKSSGDNLPSYYTVHDIGSIEGCQMECVQTLGCVGIEFSKGRCEVWTRGEGIQATKELEGFTCLRLL